MTFVGFFKCVSKKCCVGWQNVMNNFKLEDGKSDVLRDFERKAINEMYCFLIQICFYHPFFSSRRYKLIFNKELCC